MSLVDEWSSDKNLDCLPVTLTLQRKISTLVHVITALIQQLQPYLATDSRIQQKSAKVFCETQLYGI